jgi:hypothetical protein
VTESGVHLVQLSVAGKRRVAIVDEPQLLVLQEFDTVVALAERAILTGR